ncbi:MAG: hypothetical protein ACXWL5_02865 [Candidatus Chromulinivorax sp.]
MKKVVFVALCLFGTSLDAISSIINRHNITTSPLLYSQVDYTSKNTQIEFEPLVSGLFDTNHLIANATPENKLTLSLNQQGLGDINPEWLSLISSNDAQDYSSTIMFQPNQQIYGLLFHAFKQFDYLFFDLKTSLLQVKNQMNIIETGGGNGGLSVVNDQIIYNAYDAFNQENWKYGKIGNSGSLIGFDNIQLLFGVSSKTQVDLGKRMQPYFAGFALVEVPTGSGSKSEWLFEPLVGGNHWAFGFGFEGMLESEKEYQLVVGGNFRHFIANWETRTFDLTENGQWSRYLLVTPFSYLDGIMREGLPGVNLFTQKALIEGRNEINFYARLQKKFEKSRLEVSYNFYYNQAESIRRVTNLPENFGIFAIQTRGGVTTASTAKINENQVLLDSSPVELVTADLNLQSGAAGQWLASQIAARCMWQQNMYGYGFGASVDLAHTNQAYSTWLVWLQFELLI